MPKGMQPIFTRTLSDVAYWVVFNNIPQTYTDLKLLVSGRSSATGGNRDTPLMYLNADPNFGSHTRLYGIPSSKGSDRSSGLYLGYTSTNSTTSNTFGILEVYIPNYSSSNFKQIIADSVSETTATDNGLAMMASLYRSNAPVTQLQIAAGGGNWMANTTFTLYGISR
jgi:hypothetical protein